jgi:hypothetical protein
VKTINAPINKNIPNSPTKKIEKMLETGVGSPKSKVYFKTLETGEGFNHNKRRVKNQIATEIASMQSNTAIEFKLIASQLAENRKKCQKRIDTANTITMQG